MTPRVLHVCAGNLFGGVETYLVTLARCRHLAPGVEPEFAVCFRGRLWDELAASGVATHDLGPVRSSRPWTVFSGRRRLARLLEPGRYAGAVCHMPWALGLFGGVVRRRSRLLAHFHNPPGTGWPERLATWQRPERLVVPSRHAAAGYRSRYPGVPIEVLNYPLPAQVTDRPPLGPVRRAEVRAALGAGPEDVVVLQASRIEPWKGPDLTVRALARLRDLPGWRLWIAGGVQRPGEKQLFEELRRLAGEGGIADRVAFLGQRSDVPVLMQAADVYCQGNRGPEGFSLAFLEASYIGLPVVTTDVGGAGEMVDPTTGILVPPGEDPRPLAEALRRVLTDPGGRAAMGRRASEKAVRLCDTGQQLRRLAGWLVAPPAVIGA